MPHRRSTEAQQRRFARRLILKTSLRDSELAETVCRITGRELSSLMREKFNGVYEAAINQHEPGEILIDSRGRGTLQPSLPTNGDLRRVRLYGGDGS